MIIQTKQKIQEVLESIFGIDNVDFNTDLPLNRVDTCSYFIERIVKQNYGNSYKLIIEWSLLMSTKGDYNECIGYFEARVNLLIDRLENQTNIRDIEFSTNDANKTMYCAVSFLSEFYDV